MKRVEDREKRYRKKEWERENDAGRENGRRRMMQEERMGEGE